MSQPSIETLLQACVTWNASDVHLSVGSKPRIRTDSYLQAYANESEEVRVLTAEDTESIVRRIAPPALIPNLDTRKSWDFSFPFGETRFRAAIMRQKGSWALVLRRIPDRIMPLDDLGLPDQIKEILQRGQGMMLVTGPTGSGKSTTLASMVDFINENCERHILTLEDPIEYVHGHKRSQVNQRELGSDVDSFQDGLVSGLRQDPDVILVGEMRNLETIQAAVTAAETGHLVLATLHTKGAAASINRIIDVFPDADKEHIRIQLSLSLSGVLSQVLCPRLDNDGKGVIAAHEFLYVTPSVRFNIRDEKPYTLENDMQTGKKFGMRLLDDELFSLVQRKVVHPMVALEKARDPLDFLPRLKKAGLME